MTREDVGTLVGAGVNELGGEAVLVLKGEAGTASVHIPEDMAVPFRDTAREVVRVYDPEAAAPGDGLDTTFHGGEP